MTLNIGGGNVVPNPQPDFFNQIATRDEVAKEGNVGVSNVVIAPNTDDISFVNMNKYSAQQYRADPKNPNLAKPIGSFRTTQGEQRETGEDWNSIYQNLTEQLPEEVQKGLEEGLSAEYQTLRNVLEDTSKKLELQRNIAGRLELKDVNEKADYNRAYPDQHLQNAVGTGQEFTGISHEVLKLMTPNDPDYLSSKELTNNVEEFLNKFAE